MYLRKGESILILAGLIVSLMCVYLHGRRIPQYAGPYRVVILRADNTSDKHNSTGKLWIKGHTTQVRGRQPQYYWGERFAGIPINDDMTFEVRMAIRSNNEWKRNAFVFPFDRACSNLMKHGKSGVQIIYGEKYVGICPLPATGYQEIKNQSFEMIFPYFPVLPYGRYLFGLTIRNASEVVGVGFATVDIVPRL